MSFFFFFPLQFSTWPLEASTRGNKDSGGKSSNQEINSFESHTFKNKISSVHVEGKKYAHFQNSASICTAARHLNAPQFLERLSIKLLRHLLIL